MFHQLPRSLGGEGEEQNPGCRFVQPVDRIDPAPDLIADQLEGEPGLVPIDGAAVDQQPGRFVDGDHDVILVDDCQLCAAAFFDSNCHSIMPFILGKNRG